MADHNRFFRVLLPLAAVLAALALPACGGGDDSDPAAERLREQQLDEARKEGAEEAKRDLQLQQQAREQARLRRQLRRVKRRQRESGEPAPTASTGGAAPPPAATGTTSCGAGLSVGPNTSCAFAENVRGEYGSAARGGNATIQVFSPATGQSYTMTCVAGATTVCRGGNNASVFITG